MTVCKRVLYSGRVQGVGFRYTAQRVAKGFSVGGYVRNLPNGSVDLLVEGSVEKVEEFLSTLAKQMADYIEESNVTEHPPSGLNEFRIRN